MHKFLSSLLLPPRVVAVLMVFFKCNCFNGQLPSNLGQLDRLWSFTVRDNNFSGRVCALTTGHISACVERVLLVKNACLSDQLQRVCCY